MARGTGLHGQPGVESRNAITFSGKAWQVESAFHTQLHQYGLNGEIHFANATELRVPAGIASVLLNVRGLNNFRLKPLTQAGPSRHTRRRHSGHDNFLTPETGRRLRRDPNLQRGVHGAGAHVGVVGQTYAPQADIDHFRSASGLSGHLSSLNSCPASNAPSHCYQCMDPTTAHCTGSTATAPYSAGDTDLDEADLDIEWAGGVAKNATVD